MWLKSFVKNEVICVWLNEDELLVKIIRHYSSAILLYGAVGSYFLIVALVRPIP